MSFLINESTLPKDLEKNIINESTKVIDFFEQELKKIRTSRATSSLIENIKITVYSNQIMALKELALITSPDASNLIIQPFDGSTINDIERALSQSDLGIQPRNDGKSIKMTFPPMSQERRNEFIKIVSKKQEEAIISIRKIRQDYISLIKQNEKDKKLSEDSSNRFNKIIQNTIELIIKNLSLLAEKKIKQLLEG